MFLGLCSKVLICYTHIRTYSSNTGTLVARELTSVFLLEIIDIRDVSAIRVYFLTRIIDLCSLARCDSSATTVTVVTTQKCQQLNEFITDAPWYVSNAIISRDLQVPSIKQEISRLSIGYNARLSKHPNHLVSHLSRPPTTRRLKKHHPIDLPFRFH
jgi:hypothetical protein